MLENPQWYIDNQWRIWRLHFDKVVKEAYENPKVKVELPINIPSFIHEARKILTDK